LERLLATQRAQLEERLAGQEERLTAQQAEIERLRVERGERTAAQSTSPLILPAKFGRGRAGDADRGAAPQGTNGRHTSRRGLLRLGGVAAAAGLVAGAGELLRPGTAHAAAAMALDNPLVGTSSDRFVDAVAGFGTNSATGVHGTSDTGPGVFGFSQSGLGVWANSNSSYAVLAASGSSPDIYAAGTGRILQTSLGLWPPTSGTWLAGEMIRDFHFDLWLCVQGGTPGHWRKVAAPQYGYAGGALNLLPSAIRLLDTRASANDANLHPGAPVAYHGTINVPAAGVTYNMQTIPAGAVAVFGLLTAALAPGVNPGDGSSAIAWATGQPRPAAVSVIFNPQDQQGAYTANFAVVPTGSSGDFSLYSQPINPVAVDYLFDCFGFVM
jgi:hypothetical protein